MLGGAAALEAVFSTFAEPVRYEPGGGAPAIDALPVIWSDVPGDPFQGPDNTTRHITAEVRRGSVPARPDKAVRIIRGGVTWKLLGRVTERDDVDAWVIPLERA